jgi:hypothetical protein
MKLIALSALLSVALIGSAFAEPKKLSDVDMDSVAAGALVTVNVNPSINVNPQINTAVVTQVAVATSIANAICAVCIRASVSATSGAGGTNIGSVSQLIR